MRVVADTNILVDYLLGVEAARAELGRYSGVIVSHMTWMEVLAGTSPEDEMAVRRFLGSFSVQHITDDITEEAVALRRIHGIRMPDAIIWATARTLGYLLVTRNAQDFPVRDPGVRVPYTI